MGQALSNIHGVLADGQAMAPAVPQVPLTWQSTEDHAHRVTMIYKLLNIVQARLRAYTDTQLEAADYLPDIARHMELALYRRAASLSDYLDPTTLNKRLQFLALTAYPPCANDFEQLSLDASSLTTIAESHKRKLENSPMDDWLPTPKRQRRLWEASMSSKLGGAQHRGGRRRSSAARSSNMSPPEAFYLLGDNTELLMHVYSFLDGEEAARHCLVNRSAATILPRCVQSLSLVPRTLSSLIDSSGGIGGQLTKYTNLKHLTVCSEAVCQASNTGLAAFNELLQSDSSSSLPQLGFLSHNCERVMRNLVAAISAGCCAKLESLSVCSVFFDAQRNSVVTLLTSALRKGVCPNLKSLRLVGNGIGDSGTMEIANFLRSSACPNLEILDLRRNYVGEIGVAALANTLGHPSCRIKVLNLGGNVITHASLCCLTAKLETGRCGITHLSLDNNFIHHRGARVLLRAFSENKLPYLSFLNISENEAGVTLGRYLSKHADSARESAVTKLQVHYLTRTSATITLREEQQFLPRSLMVCFSHPTMLTS